MSHTETTEQFHCNYPKYIVNRPAIAKLLRNVVSMLCTLLLSLLTYTWFSKQSICS